MSSITRSPSAVAAASACILLCLGGVPAPAPAQVAQAPSLAALQGRVQTLETRVQALERRLKELEEQVAADDQSPDDKGRDADKGSRPLTVRAPFIVLDGRGRTMLRVEETRKGPTLSLTSAAGEAELTHDWLRIRGPGGDGGGVEIGRATSGNGTALFYRTTGVALATLGVERAEGRLAFKMFSNDKVAVDLGENPNDMNSGLLQLGNGQGRFTAELGTNARNEMSLKIRGNDGTTVAGLGVNPGGDGGGALKIATRAGNIVASMETKADAGHVNVFNARDGKAVANLGAETDGRGFLRIGSKRSLEAASITVGAETGSGIVQIRDPQGVGVTVGNRQGNGVLMGDMCLTSSAQKQTCLSAIAAKNLIFYW